MNSNKLMVKITQEDEGSEKKQRTLIDKSKKLYIFFLYKKKEHHMKNHTLKNPNFHSNERSVFVDILVGFYDVDKLHIMHVQYPSTIF